ncbi:hypothetical protein [Brevundimonas mediterranea]|jgi:hypothetical protein|uniref:Uncharacterized protein n=1 Tax=Brevundimonas mediterranea TaxID=74329 RepID=A0A7Z8Y5U5_9CAUL|nr:hypothetical protein [Brevundimonas mediterranea]VDC51410.1 hypothetical protein BREV_BREV_00479 [Brevundimonas mediterranea]
MNRPWFEAAPALAAAGVPDDRIPVTPMKANLMSADYALLPRIDTVTKPRVFPSLDALAASIERQRQGQSLFLEEVQDLQPLGAADQVRAVKVWTTDCDGRQDRMIGFAYLKGAGRELLEWALRLARRPAAA